MSAASQSRTEDEIREIEAQAASLLASLKGIQGALVEADANGRLTRIEIVPHGIDDRAALRNAQSALMAVLGITVDVASIAIVSDIRQRAEQIAAANAVREVVPAPQPVAAGEDEGVLSLRIPAVKNGELNVAASVAFDTLRAAQRSFQGFVFDGAELVRIAGHQYVVVAVRRAVTEARYCGAAPVIDSVSTASARALMNAVGTAAMGPAALELELKIDGGYEALEA